MTDEAAVVGDRYHLGEILGRGGMATVHRGLDRRLNRPVAVKQLSVHLAADRTAQTRFRREAQAAASLNHPAIASVFDTGEGTDPGTGVSIPFIVMELVEGSTLRELLNDGPLPTDRALRITASVLDALAHSHTMGLIHRDIKPANVMLTATGAVKVMDFGIARAVDETSTSLTQTASVIGTAQYLSPEQAMGKPVDLRSDLYSVGCLLFELLTGRPPFVADTSIGIAYQHVREAPIPPSQLNPALNPAVDAVVLRALAKNREDRYQTAAEMRADVDRVLAGAPVAIAPLPAVAEQTAAFPAPTQPAGVLPELPASGVAAPAVTAPTALVSPAALRPPPPQEADEKDRRRSGVGRPILVVLGVFLLLGLGALGLSQVFSPAASNAEAVTVPDVRGQTRDEAAAALRKVALVPRFDSVAGKNDDTVGTVVKQSPAADGQVDPESTVTLTINVGPDKVKIPDGLIGDPVEKVEKRLKEAGFKNVTTEAVRVDDVDAEDVDAGDVVSVEPDEGKSVALDEDILVRYAREVRQQPVPQPEAPEPAPTRSAEKPSPDDAEKPSPDDKETTEPDDDETTREPDAPTTSAPPPADPEPTEKTKPPKPEPTKPARTPAGGGQGGVGGQGGGQGRGGGNPAGD
ncbi:MAG: Serine/threonine-protein kinase PknB [uncultured Friedmanniella sp.]|uniref:non-specific serine/threonine protein kinase n=1 Tax=uncultured Friedmanniella sp. TaxID=335381 RepID=A0A6J4KZ56_9ACTN|nr:Stk1 family PASTA domain-containing Ser/Thr kinase [uncultured Friedmanniella sp.]CAA9317866.1 MAG: Serine/threonine-protein kinase PknB [uncultured Friedmanniella sp.]